MKNRLYQFVVLAIFASLLITSCTKENIDTPEAEINQEILKRDASGPSISIYPESSSINSSSKSLFCCDVEWIGLQNSPNSTLASFTWTFNRYTVPSANAYRHNFTIFRNDVLFWSGTFPASGNPNCPTWTLYLNWPNGLGNCCGVFSATMADEYRVGSTWYTCDADHGEFDYFPFGCGWCE